MTLLPEGGAALPVSVTTTRKVQGGAAIPVYGYMTAPTDGRPALGGPALPVRVLTAADLKQNGGQWTLEGRPYAMPVYTAPAGVTVMGGPALAVYPVNAWPTVAVAPAWVPTDIAGLQLWLKADAGLFKDAAKAQPCTADADAVYTWADQSGSGNDLVQATEANRPLYKVNIQNGKPVVRFDGANDYLAKTVAIAQPFTVLMVFIRRGTQNLGKFFADVTTATPAVLAYYDTGTIIYVNAGTSGPNAAHNINTAYLVAANFNGASTGIALNGAAYTVADAGTNGLDGVSLGAWGTGATPLNYDLGEILLYNSTLSAGNRTLAETYLNGRWAVY